VAASRDLDHRERIPRVQDDAIARRRSALSNARQRPDHATVDERERHLEPGDAEAGQDRVAKSNSASGG
jgi:hypothetical protein